MLQCQYSILGTYYMTTFLIIQSSKLSTHRVCSSSSAMMFNRVFELLSADGLGAIMKSFG